MDVLEFNPPIKPKGPMTAIKVVLVQRDIDPAFEASFRKNLIPNQWTEE